VRLDEEKIEALRSWGERLRESGGEESAAVGRAILMLVEEVDRLHIELWHARIQGGDRAAEPGGPDDQERQVAPSLHSRLRQVLGRHSTPDPREESEQPALDTESEAASSAQAWIAALRRAEGGRGTDSLR
jgi:hypothetical protein